MTDNASEIIKIPNITPIRERGWYRAAIVSSGLILFGILAFGLGRLSKIEENKPDLVIEQIPISSTNGGVASNDYVASKNGTKYYLANCASAKRILPSNLVHYASKAEAEARGLTPASNCPGL